MTLKSFGERERWSCDIPFEFHAALGGNMAKYKKSVSSDNALRDSTKPAG
jgi:hypothetical protein